MPQKIAVAIIHGIGQQEDNFAQTMIDALRRQFKKHTGIDSADALVIQRVYWAPKLDELEQRLAGVLADGDAVLRWRFIRHFMIHLVTDQIAYAPTPGSRKIYDQVHGVMAETLNRLAHPDYAGPQAPLCIIGHSLGSVIASNYIYDMQAYPEKNLIGQPVWDVMGDAPLERLETLSLLYTLGSPLALWSLPYPDFGLPVNVPSDKLGDHYPGLQEQGDWVNFYDPDDAIALPLCVLNERYEARVRDVVVNAGNMLRNWNPMSHLEYWGSDEVSDEIGAGLARVYQALT
jgi:hypothetical protein